MKETILFVDDDLNLLQGLQRMLRPRRNEWEMTFVASPREALALLTQRCFDVVVTDMRMPEMDGADLLEEVKKICPRSVRIILSGQAEIETIIKSIGSAHQYLSKPCNPELLQATINRASQLRRIMGNTELEQFVSQLQSIPSQPGIYDAVKAELETEQPSIEMISGLIVRDIGMSAKVLQLTNSSFFGEKREVISPKEAVGIIGVDILRKLFFHSNTFSNCEDGQIGGLNLDRLHKRGTSVGNFALRIATIEGLPPLSGEVFSSTGLISRIGCIVLALYMPERHREVLQVGEECQASVDLEMRLFQTSHSEIGGYLLGLWGLPDQIVEAALRHHECKCLDKCDVSILSALQIAEHIASSTGYETGQTQDSMESLARIREKYSELALTD